MPLIRYKTFRFSPTTLATIQTANAIIAEYAAQGFDLTLRQLFYQFVSRGLISNCQSEYKRFGGIINDGRLAGLIDWDAITDLTRNLRELSHWSEPADIVRSAAESFRLDKWANQDFRIEVWVEKDALAGVLDGVCTELDVPYFSCRGYTSQSEMWAASQRLLAHRTNGQTPVILHLGDHDPSGLDMSRDIQDRLELFTAKAIKFERLALNSPQIDQYSPPPNPAKVTDSRFESYRREYGDESWELDALEPAVITSLIRNAVADCRDDEAWHLDEQNELIRRQQIESAAERWPEIVGLLNGGK